MNQRNHLPCGQKKGTEMYYQFRGSRSDAAIARTLEREQSVAAQKERRDFALPYRKDQYFCLHVPVHLLIIEKLREGAIAKD